MPSGNRERFLKEFPSALLDDAGAIFVGAGVSKGAGYPTWAELLEDIGDELGLRVKDVHDLAGLAQWSIQATGNATRVKTVIRDQISPNHPVPPLLETIARLPVRNIWTTNYDRLIERAFENAGRPIHAISVSEDLPIRGKAGATKLYKMHGSIDRLDDLVISTDDYELYRKTRGAFLPMLQAHLTSMSMLFVGLSLTDPNIRHVLSIIRESFGDTPPAHFAIVRPPQRSDSGSAAEHLARTKQHQFWARDLTRYGLYAIEIDAYSEVPKLLLEIERRVAQRRIWVSGSWSVADVSADTGKVYSLATAVGNKLGKLGYSLVSGAGTVVGSATISGFLDALRRGGGWDIERRLIARPFPQPVTGSAPDPTEWTALRKELRRLSGGVIFIGGTKEAPTGSVIATGVMEEYRLAKASGAFLLPIGATGGAAKKIARLLSGSSVATDGDRPQRPTDSELVVLSNPATSQDQIVRMVEVILRRVLKI